MTRWIGPPPRKILLSPLKSAKLPTKRPLRAERQPRIERTKPTAHGYIDAWLYGVRLKGVVTHLRPHDPRWVEGGTPEVPDWAYIGFLAECCSAKSDEVIDRHTLGVYFRSQLPWLHRKYVRVETPSKTGAVVLRQTLVYYHVEMLTR